MVRVGLVLILMAAGPAWSCGANAASTFCEGGWVTQPVEARRHADDQAAADDGADPVFIGEQGVYVEGAVVLDDPPPGDGGEL